MTTETKQNRIGKPYAIRSSATRAAKQDGFDAAEITVREVEGGFAYFLNDAEPVTHDELAEVEAEIRSAEEADAAAVAAEEAPELQVVATETVTEQPVELDKVDPLPEPTPVQEAPKAEATPVAEAPKAEVERLKKSTIDSPTKTVWAIADEMIAANPNVRRKDVIAAAVAKGIAFYTARTQYQQWLTARKESEANAAAVNGTK